MSSGRSMGIPVVRGVRFLQMAVRPTSVLFVYAARMTPINFPCISTFSAGW